MAIRFYLLLYCLLGNCTVKDTTGDEQITFKNNFKSKPDYSVKKYFKLQIKLKSLDIISNHNHNINDFKS